MFSGSLQYIIFFAGIWASGNGILHDIAILRQNRPFEKELIRLLMDGHLLIFAGIFYFICYRGIINKESWALYVSMATAVFLLGYCALIFKMLPSIGTILVNLVVLVSLISNWKSFHV